MKYIIQNYEIQETNENLLIFCLDENRNIIFNKCVILEGTGPVFFKHMIENDTLDVVANILLTLFNDVDINQLYKDLYSFADKLNQIGLLKWRD